MQINTIGWVQREICLKHSRYAAGITSPDESSLLISITHARACALSHENDIPRCPLPSSSQPDRFDVNIPQRTFGSDRRFGNGLDARHKDCPKCPSKQFALNESSEGRRCD